MTWLRALTLVAAMVAAIPSPEPPAPSPERRAPSPEGRQDQPTRFRSSAQAVLVDVQVREGNAPVAGLTADDFELRDSGVVQTIEAVTFEDVPVSLMLALDVSGSVQGAPLEHLKEAARAAAAATTKDDQAALLTFSERIGLRTGWTRDRGRLEGAIGKLSAGGATALHDGIFAALGLRNEAAGRTLLVVFSDGEDTSSWLDAPAVLQAARETDVVVYGVSPRPLYTERALELNEQRAALKRWFDSDPDLFPQLLLERVTEETGGEFFFVDSTHDLPGTFARIVGDFKSRYLLSYTPTGVATKGWHPLTVKLKGRTGTVRARPGYSAR
jgi:Ca-activated chloride channel family protein